MFAHTKEPSHLTQFKDLGLNASILEALTQKGYTVPTPIQLAAIPGVMEGRDLLGIAQTGTGKTAAFALPILHRLAANRKPAPKRGCRVLVLSPTRELATQIADNFKAYGGGTATDNPRLFDKDLALIHDCIMLFSADAASNNAVALNSNTVVTFLHFVLKCILILTLDGPEEDAALVMLDGSFRLVKLTVLPLIASKKWCACFA